MSSKYKVGEDAIPHFVTFSVVGWVTSHFNSLSAGVFMALHCASARDPAYNIAPD